MHPLGSPYVRDQLSARSASLNARRVLTEQPYVLYLMERTQRLHDNWALRLATIEADRMGKPVLVCHLAEHRDGAIRARAMTFQRDGSRELAAAAAAIGIGYRFLDGDPRASLLAVRQLLRHAALLVTDQDPLASRSRPTASLVAEAECRAVTVDSFGIVPLSSFPKPEYSARTFRPKFTRQLEGAAEPVADRPPRRAFAPVGWLTPTSDSVRDVGGTADAATSCGLMQDPCTETAPRGGRSAGVARLGRFCDDALRDYRERRCDPSDDDGTSQLSAHLRHGMLSPLEVMNRARASEPGLDCDAFLGEALVWRELAGNFCRYQAGYDSLAALPDWAHRTIAKHADDARAVTCTRGELERAESPDPLWNAAQTELLASGRMHPVMRMYWGKAVLGWAPTAADAFDWLIHLNDSYALDAQGPSSYAGVQWCFGRFDRPFIERPVWGTIRPMLLSRLSRNVDLGDYLDRWRPRALSA